MITITGTINIADIKRCYIDDMKLSVLCPECQTMMAKDFSEDYLSYPVIGEEIEVGIYCDECDAYFSVPIKVIASELTIECDVGRITKQ